MLQSITELPIFGVTITLVTYLFGVWLNKKTKLIIVNPLLISCILIISFLVIFKIPYKNYYNGSIFFEMLIPPATTALALSMYNNFEKIKKNFLSIIVGCVVGALTSIISVIVLCSIFKIPEDIYISLLPKSVTTAIGIQTSQKIGGLPAITSTAIFLTGFFIGIFGPYLIKIFKIKNSVAAGLALGTSGHGFATAKALQLGETEGAMSSIAICITGIATVIILAFF